ncbi:MAG TPA: hypothetical protein PKI71_05055 [Candidatus Rifleibacterium sp.]|nr:hypothetical protein [Candidatus Rifleibacterium sp.]
MQLTNKTNGRFFWRDSGNRFFIEIDGKPVELKFTLAQSEAYQAFITEDRAQAKEEFEARKKAEAEALKTGADIDPTEFVIQRITKSIATAASQVAIALNPKEEKQFTREQVIVLFNEHLDLLQIVSRTWVEKKVFNPMLDSVLDPHLAP